MSILDNRILLNNLLEQANSLPDAGESGENLDEEVSTQETLISEQNAKIAELAEILSSKASGGEPNIINFTIEYGGTHSINTLQGQAEDGMTIGSWVCSDANPIYPDDDHYGSGLYVQGKDIVYGDQAIGQSYLKLNNVYVSSRDKIISNAIYQAIKDTSNYE